MILDINYATFSCGGFTEFPVPVANLISMLINIVKVIVPVVLIVMGLLDFTKAVMAQKEDEIKKAQMTFIKRLIAGALVFFVFVIVKLLVSVVADNSTSANKIIDCADCFLNGIDNCKVSKGG